MGIQGNDTCAVFKVKWCKTWYYFEKIAIFVLITQTRVENIRSYKQQKEISDHTNKNRDCQIT